MKKGSYKDYADLLRQLDTKRLAKGKQLFSLTGSCSHGQKSLGQYSNIHIFLSFLGSLIKQCILFEIFLQFSVPHPIQSWNSEKKFWIHASNILCGVRGGVGPVWIGKRRRKAKVSQDFSPWMYLFGMNDGGRFSTQRIEQASVGNCLRFPDSSSLFTRELSRFFFGLYPSANLLTGSEPFSQGSSLQRRCHYRES